VTDNALTSSPAPVQDVQPELQLKLERVLQLLDIQKVSALLIERNENIAWITGGMAARRVLLSSPLTKTPAFPIIHTEISGTNYLCAGMLIRS
jgi:hypothetical protein